jgi:hypothetical protein
MNMTPEEAASLVERMKEPPHLSTAEMGYQILAWIRRAQARLRDPQLRARANEINAALLTDIETLCKEQTTAHTAEEPARHVHIQIMVNGKQAAQEFLTVVDLGQPMDYEHQRERALRMVHDQLEQEKEVPNTENVNEVKNFELQFHQDSEYSEEPKPGTWHWPEKA